MKKKKGLGRGLSALFGDDKIDNKPKTKNIASNTKALIGDLTRNPYQPRQIFNEEKLEELANSIKKNGVIQPIAVRPGLTATGCITPFFLIELANSSSFSSLKICLG